MVEWKKLWELTAWDKKFTGIDKSMQKKIIKYYYYLAKDLNNLESPNGDIRILYTTEKVAFADRDTVEGNISQGEVVAIPWGGNASVKYFKGEFVTADNRIATSLDTNILSNKFLYYWMFSRKEELESYYRGAGIKHPSMYSVLMMDIPIPSLSEQQRIVETLDTFTASIDNLKEQIAQRRKQYEHYRDQLLDFSGNNVEWKPLVWAFPFIRNGFVGTVTPFFTDKDNGVRYLEGTNIHDGTISDNKELYVTYDFHRKHIKNELKADDILMVQSGHIGECAIVGEKYKGANCHALIIMSNGGKCNSKFIVYYFHTGKGFKSLSPAITGGAIKHVLAKKVGKIMIPIPSLSEQSRIVSILDSFEASIANLEEQLALRQKQYEYYREKLLTFE